MQNISILGSTGSIGCNTLHIVEKLSSRFRVSGLAAGRNLKMMLEQVERFRPRIISMDRKEDAEELKRRVSDKSIHVTYGQKGAEEVAGFEKSDIVVSAITGIKGLRPTLAAVKKGKKVALANKESMVVAGRLIQEEAVRRKACIVPVDSEHSGAFQCLEKEKRQNVKKVILTASGGPFLRTPLGEIEGKSVEEALAHPRWKMGRKVTIDSATLMNKGLELIEARWLFGLEPEQLAILIHPQSIVHSLVELKDGSVLAQLSPTDMKVPIQYALTYPEREESLLPSLDLSQIRVLEFYRVDEEKFPLIRLAYAALKEGESFSVSLNAANEVAVDAFLRREIPFSLIHPVVREAVEKHRKRAIQTLDDIFEIDRETRERTKKILRQRS
ncbi:MAG: 1-deoxy-D-xylulose-5-phosphate reductoisomerase [Candidatus Aminicenantales bacterium]